MTMSRSTGLKNEMGKSGGKSLADALANGIIRIFDGSRPANADATEGAAQILCEVTLDGGDFTPGAALNGINLDLAVAGVVSKAAAEVWKGSNLLAGTAVWFRFYDNAVDTGASATAIRMDGSVSTSISADMTLPSTALNQGGTTTLDSAEFELP